MPILKKEIIMQRMKIVLLVTTLACLIIFLAGSCATKRIRVGEEVGPPGQRTAAEVRKGEEPGGARLSPEEAERRGLAEERGERREDMRQREREQMLQSEALAFESEPIYFDFDESILKPQARAILEKKASWLRANPEYSLRIEGHCDERGTSEYNVALGEKRAVAAAEYLRQLGISAERISTISYGEERPADPRHAEEAWAKNRRDEFRLIQQ
jgi:peptidoglycan-associated lipoprotein